MSATPYSPSRYPLRSDCKAHGNGCSCRNAEELPPSNRRRSVSRTPSRASSVAPELSISEPINLFPQLSVAANGYNKHQSYQSHTTTTKITSSRYSKVQNEGLKYTSSHRNLSRRNIEEELDGRLSRNINFDQDRLSTHSHSLYNEDDRSSTTSTRSNFQNSYNIIDHDATPTKQHDQNYHPYNNSSTNSSNYRSTQMIKTYNDNNHHNNSRETTIINNDSHNNIYSSDEDNDDNNSILHTETNRPPMALLNSQSSSIVGKSSKTTSNGHQRYHRRRTVTTYNIKSKEDAEEEEDDDEGESSLYVQSSLESESKFASVRRRLMFIPEFIYWALVNVFVCEKWLLHRSANFDNTSIFSAFSGLKKLLYLGLLILLGMLVYNSSGYFMPLLSRLSIPTTTDSFISSNTQSQVPISAPLPPPSLPPTATPLVPAATASQPCNLSQSEEYQKLLEKIALLERTTNEYKEKAEESYKTKFEILEQTLNFNLKQEILKIEPKESKVIVEKETVIVEKEPPQVIIQKTEPEPINFDEISKVVAPLILPSLLEKIRTEIKETQVECPEEKNVPTVPAPTISHHHGLDLSDIEKMIRAAIYKYDADKTGLPDLALEPAGGSILSTRCTKSSQSKNSVLYLWGWRIWSYSNSPRTIIQPGVVPGECWVVEGATAEVVIQLISPSIISGFTLEHIPKSISPYGIIDTAPKKFQVVGLMGEHDLDSMWDYGTFQYEDNEEPIQYFEVQNKTTVAYPIVELKVLSNHGNVKSTCIYRFRVHGQNISWKT